MSTQSKGREIHGVAEHMREAGEFLRSLSLLDDAAVSYIQDKEYLGLSETLGSRYLAFGHLYEQTQDRMYLILGKHAAEASVEIAEESGDKTALALPYTRLGQALEGLDKLEEAINAYKKSVQHMTDDPPTTHDRPAVLADFKARLATVELKNGDSAAYDQALEAIADLEKTDELKYNKDVWVSGVHMRLAEVLKSSDKEKAKKHLGSAKKIIDLNKDLRLRAKQWEKLSESFK